MALRPLSQLGGAGEMEEEDDAVGYTEPGGGAEASGKDVLSSAAATAGSAEASPSPTSDTSPPLAADAVTTEPGGMGGEADSLKPDDGESGAGMIAPSPFMPSERGRAEPQPELLGVEHPQEQVRLLPPDPAPDLVHAPEGEPLPASARIWKGRVYQPEPRQTRSQARAQDAPPMTMASGPVLILQFASPISASGMTREQARSRRMAPGMMTVRQAQENILRVVYDEPGPGISPEDLPSGLARDLPVPATVEEALSGPCAKLWMCAMRAELGGHLNVGTFQSLAATS